ncbi:MAG: T9SS type A sorting domain-containing protein [Saprospiraceae bacterium]|nr:T9SS type A sorting domain-containing protein [Saprospiraceae bacterium]
MCYKKIRFLLFAALTLISLGLRAQPPCNLTVEVAPPAAISCQNPSVQLQTSVTPAGNYQYSWNGPAQLPNIPNPTVTIPGSYAVFVFDSLQQCWGADSIVVTQDGSVVQATVTINNTFCDGNVELKGNATGVGTDPVTYLWSTGETTELIIVPSSAPGTVTSYCVTITNTVAGCSGAGCRNVGNFSGPVVGIDYFDNPFCGGDSLGMWAFTTFGVPPFSYLWNNGNSNPFIQDPVAGTYIVTVTDSRGCTAVATYVLENNPDECANVEGYVLADWNTNCTKEPSDEGLANITIRITDAAGVEFFTYTNADGFYHVELYAGTYTLEVITPNNLWTPCQASYTLTVNPNETLERDFLLQPGAICPAMTVDIGVPMLRRCFSNTYWIHYCNQGTAEATDAYTEIQFDDFLSVTSSSIAYTDLGNNLFRFDLGTVPLNHCSAFSVTVIVSCDATIGQTHCSEAVIYPTGNCEPLNSQWSGASLQVEAECNTDSLKFTIRNVGNATTSSALEYVIIEDAVMFMNAPPPAIFLAPAEEHHITVPANGSTWRVEVTQEIFHPGLSVPMQTVEGCANGGQFSIGFVNQLALGDNDPWTDIDCTPNVGSYDPNDKQGFPLGYGAARYIKPGTDLEYLIRFQNTGTDTAFTVVIRDTLSAWLDAATVRPGASSHPYSFEFYGDRNIKFTFDNILLPDSNTNLDASIGFVSFRIAQKADVPLETDILNSAAIFFDFNAPVITNTTLHRVGDDFITVSAWQPLRAGLELRMLPNPVAQTALLELRGIEGLQEWQVELRDATGRSVRTATANGEQWRFERGNLPAGLYMLQVRSNGQLLGSGKVVLR